MNRLEYLKNMLAEGNKDPFVLFALAKEYENMDDNNLALEYYNRLKSEKPEYVGLYYHLGKLYEKLERLEEALATYEEGVVQCRKVGDNHALSELNGAIDSIES